MGQIGRRLTVFITKAQISGPGLPEIEPFHGGCLPSQARRSLRYLLRVLIVGAATMFLASCETDSGWRPHTDSALEEHLPAKPIRNTAKAADPNDSYCRGIANQRADDAKVNRFGADIQNLIYRGTYKDCVAWLSQHVP